MNITLWFRKIYASILGIFSGSQSVTSPETSASNQEQPVSTPVKNLDPSAMKSCFLELSAALTGFSKFELQGTGQADLYYSTVAQKVDQQVFQELLQTFHDLDQSNLETGLSSDILESEKFGAIARNIVKLWYVATWYPLPSSQEEAFIVSPQAYPEGLLWSAIGVNPPAAKAPGYGTWSEKPTVTLS